MVHLASFTNISDEIWPLTYISRTDKLVRLVCLSIQFLLAYIHDWHQTITAYLPCSVLVPRTIILALWLLTLAQWPLPWLCLLLQNCLNETSHQCQNGTFAASCQYLRWLVTTILSESNITSMLKGNIWWILQISYIGFKDGEPGWPLTYFSRSDKLQ